MNFLKDIYKQLKKIDRSEKQLRKFSILFLVIIVLIGFFFFLSGKEISLIFYIILAYFIVSLYRVELVSYLYLLWMGISLFIGYFVSRLLLIILYYLFLLPIGLCVRVIKGDFLNKKINKDLNTYWIKKEPVSKQDLENLF